MDEAIDQETVLVAPAGEAGITSCRPRAGGPSQCAGCRSCADRPHLFRQGAFGAIVLARDDGPFTQNDVDLLDAIAVSAGGALAARHDADRSFIGFVVHRIRRTAAAVLWSELPALQDHRACCCSRNGCTCVIHDTVRVTAPGTVNGEARRAVSAPLTLPPNPVRPRGDVVRAGTVIANCRTTTLSSTACASSRRVRQTEAERDQALAKRDLAQAAIAKAALEQKMRRSRWMTKCWSVLAFRAPFDAVVVSGDLAQSIGKPVSRGDVLYELAPSTAIG